MEHLKNWKPLKLMALDDQDLQIFSQCLYECIIIISEINYDQKSKRFAMAIERFTWEHANGQSHLLMQVLSVLIVNGVEKIDMGDIFNTNKIKNILSVSNIDNNILILLNNEEVINLEVKKWTCLLEDIGTPFLPITVPAFQKNE